VDIKVENAFDDLQYPISGKEGDNCGLTPEQIARAMTEPEPEKSFICRFENLHFDAGQQHMNGEMALKFARSRHALGDEGTDFARAKRQQLLIGAIKTKVFSTETFLHPEKIEQIYSLLKKHIDTDIDPGQTNNLLKLALNFRESRFESVVLDEEFFVNPPVDERGWILIPKTGDWSGVHEYIKTRLK
jgi:anionic cell wall polymer biosynthesis LytR-Cps2A-Psr (LCP) family protein